MKSDFSMAAILTPSSRKPELRRSESRSPEVATDSNPPSPGSHEGTERPERDEREHVQVILDEPELWRSFHRLTNEMIVTKNGR